MKTRSAIAATLLSIFIPFYILYWLYCTAQTLRARGSKPPSLWLIFAPVLAMMALIVVGAISAASASSGSSAKAATNIALLLIGTVSVIGFIVMPFIYYYKFSVALETATSQKLSKVLTFLLFLFVAPAAVYIIQEELNSSAMVQPPQPASASAAPVPPTEMPFNPVQ